MQYVLGYLIVGCIMMMQLELIKRKNERDAEKLGVTLEDKTDVDDTNPVRVGLSVLLWPLLMVSFFKGYLDGMRGKER